MQAWLEYGAAWRKTAAEWDDACAVAHSTARIALSGSVAELQRIRREWRDVEPPKGLEEFHENMVAFQDATIDVFLAFMAEKSEWEVAALSLIADIYYMRAFDLTSDECLARIELARPTPTPSPTPSPTSTPRPTSTPTPTPLPPAEIPEGWEVAQCDWPSFTFGHPSDWIEEAEAFGVNLDIPEYGHCMVSMIPFPAFDKLTISDSSRLDKLASQHISILGEDNVTDKRVEEIGYYKCYIVEGYNTRPDFTSQDFESNFKYSPWLQARIPLNDNYIDIYYSKANAGKTIPTIDFENIRTLIATIRVK